MPQSQIDQTSFRRTLTIAIVLPLVAMVLLASVLIWQLEYMLTSARLVDHTDQVISQTREVEKLIVNMESGVRGYQLTGEPSFLQPYQSATGSIGAAFNSLGGLISDNQNQQQQLADIQNNYAQWSQSATNIVDLRERNGDYLSLALNTQAKQLMDRLRGQLGNFIETEEALRDMRTRAAQQATELVVSTITVLTLLIGGGLALLSYRLLTRLSRSYDQIIMIARSRADQLTEQRERLHVTLSSIGDAVIATDTQGRVSFTNPVAQALTGWNEADAIGQPLEQVFAIINEASRQVVDNPVAKVLREGVVVGLANHTILLAKDQREWPIDDSAAPVRDANGQIIGVVLVFRDITERKHAEAEFRASEERFRNLFEHAPIGIALGRDGKILYCNHAFVHMFGYRAAEDMHAIAMLELVAPELHEQISDRAARRARGENVPNSYETLGIRKDGTRFPYSVEATMIDLPDGPATVAFCTDITDAQRAEMALRSSEQRYRDLADAMPLIVWIARPDGAVEYFSQRWYEYTGLNAEQSLGAGWEMVIHPDELAICVERWNESIRNDRMYEIEYRWKRTDGSYQWFLGRALPVRDQAGQVAYWVGTGTNIDEQKRSEDQQRLLAEASVLLVGTLDYEVMLAQLARLTVPQLADWCAVHMIEENGDIRRLAFAHTDPAKEALVRDRPERRPFENDPWQAMPTVLRNGVAQMHSTISPEQLERALPNGSYSDLLRTVGLTSYIGVPLVARGRTLGTITFATGASGRRYTKADLALAEDLANRAAIAIDNVRLYRDAQDAVRARDQFLSIASHELKTPLTSLMGYIELIQRRARRDGTLTERDQRAMAVVGDQAARLNKLVGALLDLSRIEAGQLSIERGLVDVGELTRRIVEETHHTLDQRHSITISGTDQALIVLGDALRLEQAIQNLIQNAIKYSPAGGVVSVQIEQRENHAVLSVSDQGLGIPESALPQLFQRFYRAPNADAKHISGMGIGLYVVKEVIELHDGTIEVASEEGVGSRFTITLPLLV